MTTLEKELKSSDERINKVVSRFQSPNTKSNEQKTQEFFVNYFITMRGQIDMTQFKSDIQKVDGYNWLVKDFDFDSVYEMYV